MLQSTAMSILETMLASPGHKGSNTLTTETSVVPNCSEEENVQRCISSGFTPCCVELHGELLNSSFSS